MVYLGVALLGAIGLSRLHQDLFPPITFPEVTVVTNYFNAAPEEIETLVTKPLEEAISSVNGLRSIRSISQEGKSVVHVGFDWGIDVDFAALAVREKIDLVKDKLPRDATEPVVVKFDPLAQPVMLLSLTGKGSLIELKELAAGPIKDVLEKTEGVASATISGGLDREILIEVDQGRLYASGLSILALTQSLERTNLSYPAGTIKKGLYEHLIRTMGEFETLEDISFSVAGTDRSDRIYVPQGGFVERAKFGPRDTLESKRLEQEKERPKKRLILFKDIAVVKDSIKEQESISRYDGKENITIAIQKQAGQNNVRIAKEIRETLKKLDEELRSREANLEIILDSSIFIKDAIAFVADSAWQGALLAFITMLIFLRSASTAFIVTLAIPISILGVFFLMFIRGITINIMSLGGLALGAGMMVDQGIVIIDNIFRHREMGENTLNAAIKGTDEVLWPVFSSTLTAIAVFFPLILFVPGVPGQIFGDLAWTVILAQVVSLIVSLTLEPMLAVYIKVQKKVDLEGKGSADRFAALISKGSIAGGIAVILIGTTLLFLFSLGIFMKLDREVLPKVDQGTFLINVELPVGSKLEATDTVVKIVETELTKIPEIAHRNVTIGSAKEESSAGTVQVETRGSHQAQIAVALNEKRARTTLEVVDDLRRLISKLDLGAARIDFIQQDRQFEVAGGAQPIQIEVQGYDLNVLEKLVQSVKEAVRSIPGAFNVVDDEPEPSPETKIDIDKRKAALFGISALDIAIATRTAIDGDVPTKFREKGREVDIRVRVREEDRQNTEKLKNLLIHSEPFEIEVPINEMATVTQGLGPSEIRHHDQQRTIMVQAGILPGYEKNQVLANVASAIQTLKIPEGFAARSGGEAKEIQESFSRVIFALVLALILVYMIMAAQFESFLHPLVIMLTVPLGLIGVSFALLLTRTSLNLVSLLGIILLGGIVVNNGIVLIDFINASRREGHPIVHACIESVQVRFRPLMMSALGNIIGLFPLALGLGKGAELMQPLAIAVMGGLISSFFLTLLVVPALYILFESAIAKIRGQKLDLWR